MKKSSTDAAATRARDTPAAGSPASPPASNPKDETGYPPLGELLRGSPRTRLRPRWMPVNEWCEYCGLGKTKVNELIAAKKIKSIKVDNRRLIDVDSGVAYLEGLGG